MAAASLTHAASLAMDGWRFRAKELSRFYLVPCKQKHKLKTFNYILIHLTVGSCRLLGKQVYIFKCMRACKINDYVPCTHHVYTVIQVVSVTEHTV